MREWLQGEFRRGRERITCRSTSCGEDERDKGLIGFAAAIMRGGHLAQVLCEVFNVMDLDILIYLCLMIDGGNFFLE